MGYDIVPSFGYTSTMVKYNRDTSRHILSQEWVDFIGLDSPRGCMTAFPEGGCMAPLPLWLSFLSLFPQ